MLRAARARIGSNIEDVANVLKIRALYLKAIEEDRYDDLPGSTYAIGFLKTYSTHLGLDSDEIVRRYKIETESINQKHELIFPIPLSENGIPGVKSVFAGVVVVILAYGGWHFSTGDDSILSGIATAIPDRLLKSAEKAPVNNELDEDASSQEGVLVETETFKGIDFSADAKKLLKSALNKKAEGSVSSIESNPPKTEEKQPEKHIDNTQDKSEDALDVSQVIRGDLKNEKTKNNRMSNLSADFEGDNKLIPKRENYSAVEGIELANKVLIDPSLSSEGSIDSVAKDISLKQDRLVIVATEEGLKLNSNSLVIANQTPLVDVPLPPASPSQLLAIKTPEAFVSGPEKRKSGNIQLESIAEESVKDVISQNIQGDGSDNLSQKKSKNVINQNLNTLIVATGNSWIQIKDDINDNVLITRLMQSGDRYEVPDLDGLQLLTGNAGAIDIYVGSLKVPSIGGMGEVLRNVILDQARLKAGTAVNQ